jgi:hypothetical protein
MDKPTKWTIHNVDTAGNGRALLGCHISVAPDGKGYQFETPDHHPVSTTTDDRFPFEFPQFRARLNGHEELDWFLLVDSKTAGHQKDDMSGTWSNITYIPPHPDEDPTDSWTAQAGAGAGDDDESAASAYA